MKIKKFTAKDIKEGKRLVIEELGEDAVILSNRVIKDSTTGESLIEIVAAIDDTVNKPKLSSSSPKPQQEQSLSNLKQISKAVGTHSNELILNELDSIKSMIADIGDNIKFRNTASMGTVFSKLYKKLRNLEISEENSLRIINRISSMGIINDFGEAVYEARKIIVEGIELGTPLHKGVSCRVVVFIGSTGSGKTATLVKLAIISKLILEANCLILSADTYKVGASEQLETYSSIASIPFKAAFSPAEINQIIKENKNKDFIFVDTTGFSQKDTEQLSQLSEMIKIVSPDLIYLTIPAIISELSTNSVLKSVEKFPVDSIILTKADESESIGGILNAVKSYKIPVSYITNGIKIPEDIQPADRVILGKLAVKD